MIYKTVIEFIKANYLIIAILIITSISYSNMLGNNFVFDDHFFLEGELRTTPTLTNIIAGNYPIQNTGVYRPVRNLFYAIFIPLLKTNPVPYHLFNLGIHLCCTVLLFLIVKNISSSNPIAYISTILFGLHPIHVESVSWITAGFDLIFVAFYFASLYSYINQKSPKLTLLFAMLSFFSNEIAITLPLILFFYEYQIKKSSIKDSISHTLNIFILAVIFWLIRHTLLDFTIEKESIYSFGVERIILPLFIIGNYLKIFVLPFSLSIDHYFFPGFTGLYHVNHNPILPPPPLSLSRLEVLIPVLLSVCFLILTIFFLKRKNKISFLFCFILITLLPVSNIIPIPIIFTERYSYLPSSGFVVLLAYIISNYKLKYSKILILLVTILLSTFYFYKTFERNKDWKNDFALWESTLKSNEESVVSYSSIGTAYSRNGNDEQALKYYQKSTSLNPYRLDDQDNLAKTYQKLEMYEQHINYLKSLLEINPFLLQINYNIGNSYEKLEDFNNAKRYYLEAKKIAPNHREIIEALKRVESKTK